MNIESSIRLLKKFLLFYFLKKETETYSIKNQKIYNIKNQKIYKILKLLKNIIHIWKKLKNLFQKYQNRKRGRQKVSFKIFAY